MDLAHTAFHIGVSQRKAVSNNRAHGGNMDKRPSILLRQMHSEIMAKGHLDEHAVKNLWSVLIEMADRIERLEDRFNK